MITSPCKAATSLFGLFVLVCALLANPSLAAENSTTEDKLAIAEMVAQYSYRWDSKDSTGFSNLFTADGVMERWVAGELVTGSRVSGREEIFSYAITSHEGRLADRQTRHHASGLVFIELSANSALTENMALITHQTAGTAPAFISGSGIYRNSWRKTSEGWRITKRLLFTDRFVEQ